MKRYLVLAFAAFVVALAAPSAFATRVIFDPPSGIPPPTGTDCTIGTVPLDDYTPCNVSELNTPYSVEFVACSTLTGLVDPVSTGWCLYMTNVTHGTLEKFTFNFTVPSGGSYDDTDELTCSSQPPGFATDNCEDGTHVIADQVLNVSFFATLLRNKNFYLITDFYNSPGYATVTASVPEPGELGLFGFGLLALGVAVGCQRRRHAFRNRGAA